jgi:hypothetical protein
MCSNEVPDSLLDEYVVERWDPLQLVKTAEDIEA